MPDLLPDWLLVNQSRGEERIQISWCQQPRGQGMDGWVGVIPTCWDDDSLLLAGRIGRGAAAALVVVSTWIGYVGRVNCSSCFASPGHATVHWWLPAGREETGWKTERHVVVQTPELDPCQLKGTLHLPSPTCLATPKLHASTPVVPEGKI